MIMTGFMINSSRLNRSVKSVNVKVYRSLKAFKARDHKPFCQKRHEQRRFQEGIPMSAFSSDACWCASHGINQTIPTSLEPGQLLTSCTLARSRSSGLAFESPAWSTTLLTSDLSIISPSGSEFIRLRMASVASFFAFSYYMCIWKYL